MAITWKLAGEVLNADTKLVNITGIRTDDTDPDNPQSVGPVNAVIETVDQRLAVLAILKAKSLEERSETDKKQSILDSILASGEIALNQWEIDNG